MGWRGTVRAISAASRAAERDAWRRQKAAQNAQMVADSEDAVDDWARYIDKLVSVHTDLAHAIDWQAMAVRRQPKEPHLANSHQRSAEVALATFKSRFFDVFRGGTVKRRAALEAGLANALVRDQTDHKNALMAYRDALQDWDNDKALAPRLIAGEAGAIKEVIEEMQSLSDQDLIGSAVSFLINDGFLHAKPEVHSDEIVPNFRRQQLASGKLSETKMPVGQFNELYQDYVSSVALKIAGDLFNIVPLDEIYVTCLTQMLNPQTGHQEMTPILSVQFVRQTFKSLNLASLDPSDSMANFNHVMSFKKTKGFAQVEPLKPIVAQDDG